MGLFRNTRESIQDKQATPKPETSTHNKGEEVSIYRGPGKIGRAVVNKKAIGGNWELEV